MADKKKDKEQVAEKVVVKKPSIKTKDFILKQPLNGKQPGDKVSLGVNGEGFYKSKNII